MAYNYEVEGKNEFKYFKECPDLSIDWVQHLKEHGWAIVRNVVSKERCEYFYGGMWDFMAKFKTGIDRNDPETWKDDKWPAALHGGLMHSHGVGHEQFAWDARDEDGVINIFKTLWDTEELLVSFDGINLSRPYSKPVTPWQHTDQSGYSVGFACAQGILNLLDNGPNDGGLIVLDKSHLKHAEFFKTNPHRLNEIDWCRIRNEELDFYKDCKEIKLCPNAGDFLVFDSRTIHYACAPSEGTYRAAMYICMLPASLATPRQIEAKREAFNRKMLTSHWPHKVFVFSDEEGKAKVNLVDHNMPVLTERMKKMAGLVPYH
eukprot:TRINITY_DN2655_c0_g4_i3.p1 TRINITY_DN2655_c0_g4~~TRINITY_DN2655_c0_g4_i3.p1  ORF type:complete len:318 (+),score=68.19 TRINITY_DN2655_c0_g4_i3:123-1076(+)